MLTPLKWAFVWGLALAAIPERESMANGHASYSPQSIMARLGVPSAQARQRFADAGMRDVHAHDLTRTERAAVEQAIAALPVLHRQVLAERLHSLSFVDGIPGEGTGLTSRNGTSDSYDITLRASLIHESLSDFLTTKEQRVFDGAARGTVAVRGKGVSALTYVLLHESTHVVDATLGLTRDLGAPLVSGVWTARTDPVARLASEPALKTSFRGAPPLPGSDAIGVYRSLSRTPFVSLYSTASSSEDLAELVSWYIVERQFRGSLTIAVRTQDGRLLEAFEPLRFPGVRARFPSVEALLAKRFVPDAGAG